jgi:hypothetical protein
VIGCHAIGKLARLGQRCEVRLIERGLAFPLAPDLADDLVSACRVAAVDQQVRTLRRQLQRHVAADAVGRAGDEDRLAGNVHDQNSPVR